MKSKRKDNKGDAQPRRRRGSVADSLLDVSGWHLLRVREMAGWSRDKLSERMRYSGVVSVPVPASPNTLLRYESRRVVAPLVVTAYREAIGEGLFDALLDRARGSSDDD